MKHKELIKTIQVDKSNLEHIASTGKINGTLMLEIERVIESSNQELKRQKYNLLKENEALMQRLVDAGLEKPAISIDYSRNA